MINISNKIFNFCYIFKRLLDNEVYNEEDILKYYSTYALIKKNVSLINEKSIPLYYFCKMSKYRNTLLAKSIMYFIEFLNNYIWIILKRVNFLIIILVFIFEYIFNNGIIKNLYYVIFIFFVYKIIIDLLYFYKHTDLQKILYICICYYNMEEIYKSFNNQRGNRELYYHYNAYTQFNTVDLLQIYMLVGLDWDHCRDLYHIHIKADRSIMKQETFIDIWMKKIKDSKLIKKIQIIIDK